MNAVRFPLTTGQLRRLLLVPEHRLDTIVRAGKVQPRTAGGRRLWEAPTAYRAARLLGIQDPETLNALLLGSEQTADVT